MKFSNLIQNLEVISFHGGDPEIKGISCNSGQIREGYLFVAIRGEKNNGHRFIEEAIKRGAVAVILEEDLPLRHSLASVRVDNSRLTLAKLSTRFYGRPSSKINLIGITGTDGKTTVSYLIKSILESFAKKVGLLGTINYEIGNRIVPATNTTPDAVVLNSYLHDMLGENADYAVLEVSSHSVCQHRIDGLNFKSAIFTNFGQDHLNYHRTLEDYFQAKKAFLESLSSEGKLIINADDPSYARIIKNIKAKIFTYAIKKRADVFIEQDSLSLSLEGIKFKLCLEFSNSRLCNSSKDFFVQSPLIGEYNVYNILAAICFCLT
ncbi:MAG: UDP-N-acetylmuramoyl-L-alanyl-D-glutamate--2,6-diaminopimelate ligase, partial [Candidatus Omnitrophica bacterium]|nr:UDP-N-acetylmuramoyl-L-alanyl-D-glutamate--2,6-diaminopimelate ligase [Candidatus Omnitrophota bacterium]